MPLAFAKFWPRKWLVPACSALRSCIIASMAERTVRARKTLAGCLLALDDRHGHPVLGEIGVHVEHAHRLFDGFLPRGVRRVPFLPQELGRAQKQPRAHLPAHDVRPLVDQQRQVAIALHPARERVADDGLGRRPHHQRLLELAGRHELAVGVRLEPVVCDHCALRREPFDVRRFLLQERQRDEQRKVRVLVARGFEHVVERALHVLPERVAPGSDDHAAAHGRVFGEVGTDNDLLVPLGVVLGTRRRDGGLGFVHNAGRIADGVRFCTVAQNATGVSAVRRNQAWRSTVRGRSVEHSAQPRKNLTPLQCAKSGLVARRISRIALRSAALNATGPRLVSAPRSTSFNRP